MSTNFKLTAVSCVLSALVAGWAAPASANLLTNPGFEAGNLGATPDDWVGFSFTTSSTQDDTMPHSGSHALVEGGGGTATSGSTGVFQQFLNVLPQTQFTLTGWAKAGALPISTDDPLGGPFMALVFEDDSGAGGTGNDILFVSQPLGPTGGSSGNVVTGNGVLSTSYQQFTVVGTAPTGTTQMKVQLYMAHSDQSVFFDDLDLTSIPPPNTPVFSLTVDRDTGNLTLENIGTGTGTGNIKEVKITSASGALDPISWTSISGNYDNTPVTGDGSVDANDIWSRTTQTNFELTEGETSGDAGFIAVGATVDLGDNAWIKSLTEDIVAEVTYEDGSGGIFTDVQVSYTGGPNGGDPFERSDFDFDGDVDAQDWPFLRDQLFSAISSTSEAVAYQSGDLNGDFKSDFGDFNIFQADFDAANGVGAFEAMIAGVPEPSTLALLAFGAIGLSLARKRKIKSLSKAVCCLAVVLAAAVVAPSATFAADVDFTTFTVDNYPLIKPDSFNRFQVPTYTTTTSSAILDVSSNPHAFYGTQSILNKRITGTINPGADNDFFGLVLGYTAGYVSPLDPSTNPTGADFLLLDWKFDDSTQEMEDDQADHLFFYHDLTLARTATAGVALSRVAGSPTGDELWGHFDTTFANSGNENNPFGGVTELQRGAASGSTGYLKNQDHVFDIAYTASNITVKINGTEEINISGSFPDGVLGLYSMDQNPLGGAPTYSNFKISDLDEGLLTATINTLSGSVTLSNETSDPITLNGYVLESPTSSLDFASWSSLQDQNLAGFAAGNGTGNGWEENAGSSDSTLVEANLATTSTLGVGASVSLGTAFDTGGSQDLVFSYNEGNGLVSTGLVTYVSTVEDADFDDDGDVDGKDFLAWQRGFGGAGSANSDGNADGDSDVDGVDLGIWEDKYGDGVGPLSAVQSVPEPSTALLLILASCGLGMSRSRR